MRLRSPLELLGFDLVDRYISRTFWSSYLVAFLFFFGFFVVIDLFTKSEDFVRRAGQLGLGGSELLELVTRYYACASPMVFLQVAPFVTVIGVIVALARMQRSNEIIPIVMSGRSLFRLLRPVFVFAGFLMVAMILVQELLAPRLSTSRIALEEYLVEGRSLFELERAIEDPEGWIWTRLRYDPIKTEIVEAWIMRRTEVGSEFGLVANTVPDRQGGGWKIPAGMDLRIDNGVEQREERIYEIESSLTPEQIVACKKQAFDLSIPELGQLHSLNGEDRFQVLLHYHITFPLTNLLLVLLTTPFVLRFDRRNAVAGLAIAFALCGAYFGLDFTLRALGEQHLNPILAAWFSPIFFGALGISLFDGVRT